MSSAESRSFFSHEAARAAPRALAEAAAPFVLPAGTGGRTAPLPAALFDEMVGSGRLTEDQALEILARRIGVPRVSLALWPPDPALSDLLPAALCLRHAMVPWLREEDGIVLATARPEVAADPDLYMPAGLPPARVVLASLAEVQDHLAATHRAALTRRMSARPRAQDSFRGYVPTRRLRVVLGLTALAGMSVAALAPGAAFLALLVLAAATLCLAFTFKTLAMIACLRAPGGAAPPEVPAVTDLPVISILVPLFREKDIAGTLVRRLQRLDYPRGRLEVLLVLEESDALTAEVLNRTELPPWVRIVTVPEGQPRTKPRAMNYALDFCRGEIIGVYDAEDAPAPDQLLAVAARFASAPGRLACLQGALDYYNPRDGWIARCFTLEYNTWFRLYLRGMARLGLPVPLGGTTLFVRRAALEAVGAWDAHNVTEDADLGLRLARYGWRTEVIDSTTGEEAISRAVPWIRQRSRWLKGYMVTYMVQMRRPRALWRRLGPLAFIGMQAHFVTALMQYVLGPLLGCFWLVALGLVRPFPDIVPDAAITLFGLLFALSAIGEATYCMIATRAPRHRHLWPWVPMLLLYYPMAWIAAYKALFELLVVPFYWDKTPHGLTGTGPAEEPAPPGPR